MSKMTRITGPSIHNGPPIRESELEESAPRRQLPGVPRKLPPGKHNILVAHPPETRFLGHERL